MINTEYHF